ncbi:MAG TPA: hypothetical protein VE978_20615 [Chitinophagales bacterium]|nr:hypothetical protein [Chitinophagales bacterium]
MAFDWNEYINLAEKLIEGNPSDAQLRSANSRAYYGAFLTCRNKSPYANKKAGDVHFLVMSHFRRDGATKKEYSISGNLDTLRIKRNDSDYDGHFKPLKIETANFIKMARYTVKLLNELEE